ncbi:MAG: phosphotransferase enzyme family protein [Bacteroidetes bacterium 4572_117]|nr:MAG: phosphotransferase enzyme family protein [Bacteroidetes bacterium 4572_117]
MNKEIKKSITELFAKWCGEDILTITALPESGSYRKYFRIKSKSKSVIAAHNEDRKENIAFLKFSKHFKSKNLPVPEIYAENLDENIYLQEDLGDTTLFNYVSEKRAVEFPDDLINMIKKVIDQLVKFQVEGASGFDYSYCYPREAFDKQSMMWDLNYFKYYFLKLAKIPFDEQDLESDFLKFSDYLLGADTKYFLYRDFQTRNVMIYNDEPYFIDYQGGRQGSLHYDLASLLYDAKADIPQVTRNTLQKYYIEKLAAYNVPDIDKFDSYFFGYILIRIMQAMGAYGFRGFYEKKSHFLRSIPFAIQNLEYLLDTKKLPVEFPELMKVLRALTKSEELKKIKNPKRRLTVNISSFSYKKGLPVDKSGNGGGFIFDCRAVHNPGKYEKYVELTGRDKEVIEFFEKEEEMHSFLKNAFKMVDQSVDKYMKRRFTSLMVSFGCTGGQHRSVYSAEQLFVHLKNKFDVDIELNHREIT